MVHLSISPGRRLGRRGAREQRLVDAPDGQRPHVPDGAVVAVLVQRFRRLVRQAHLDHRPVETARCYERFLVHSCMKKDNGY